MTSLVTKCVISDLVFKVFSKKFLKKTKLQKTGRPFPVILVHKDK